MSRFTITDLRRDIVKINGWMEEHGWPERLEEGGYLALQTQFHPNDVEAFKKWYYHQDPTHIVFFTAKTFKVLCEVYGCELIADNGKNMVVIKI